MLSRFFFFKWVHMRAQCTHTHTHTHTHTRTFIYKSAHTNTYYISFSLYFSPSLDVLICECIVSVHVSFSLSRLSGMFFQKKVKDIGSYY